MSWLESTDKEQTNRERWQFKFTVGEVLVGVAQKIEHHTCRLAWWENEMDQAEAGLVDKGFEYRERRNSLGEELVVVGDPELAKRVSECRNSIQRHKERKQEYETWQRVLDAQKRHDDTAELPLKYADVENFGL